MPIDVVKDTMRDWILERADQLNEVLEPFQMRLYDVIRREVDTLDIGCYPNIQFGTMEIEKDWVATGPLIEEKHEMEIYGYILHNDLEGNERCISQFADALSMMFELELMFDIQVPARPYKIHYHSKVPFHAYNIGYDQTAQGRFLRMFTGTWTAWVTRGAGVA